MNRLTLAAAVLKVVVEVDVHSDVRSVDVAAGRQWVIDVAREACGAKARDVSRLI